MGGGQVLNKSLMTTFG